MKARVVMQIGVYDRKPEDGISMMRDPADLVAEVLENITFLDFKETDTWKLADGSVHLREYTAEIKGLK